ncbi:MAG: glycosyltransferase family 2 protein [Lachnospiraceae bacterium]|nr:glycosyltransferase family 2 protein [Lachnospiraceae bacterium]
MHTLTVFTPSYNRENMLPRLYKSLTEQTNKDFEWLIVDDGSTDKTRKLVESFKAEKKISIRYHYQKNGGKMRAHNTGVRMAETEIFVCLDSDDYFTKSAVNDILDVWKNIRDDKECAGIVAHKGSSETEILYNEEFPENLERTTIFDLRLKGFKGETTLVFRTDVLKEYEFPEIDREKYVPEDYVYDLIGSRYYLHLMPEILTVCELVEKGYTDRVDELRWNNPTAWYLYYVNRAKAAPWCVLKFKYAAHCLRFSLLADDDYKAENPLPPLLILCGLPGALALSLRRKL